MVRLLLLAGALALAGARPAAAQSDLPLDLNIDTATFYYDDALALVEVYLAIGAESLAFEAVDGRFEDEVELRLALRPAASAAPDAAARAPVFADTLDLQFVLADTSGIEAGQYYLQQVRAAVAPGEYELEVAVPSASLGGRGDLALRQDLTVPDFAPDGRVRLSDLTIASSITRAAENADVTFVKNGLDIRPNPGRLFGNGAGQVFYYTEAYGLDAAVEDDAYVLLAYVAQANLPQPLEGLERRTERAVRSPDVLVGGFDISGLPSGSYFLRLALLNNDNEALAEQSQKFFVFNPDVAAPELAGAPQADDYMATLYASMDADELEENLAHARVIAASRERARLDQLSSEEAKREFLAEFWRVRDPDPRTPVNEARRDFYERLLYAEERYATSFQEVYETDQGRVLLKYGYPSNVDPRRSQSDLRPHEIWVYDNIPGEGRSQFIFADLDGFGAYELVHSDVTGEVTLPNWQQELRQ